MELALEPNNACLVEFACYLVENYVSETATTSGLNSLSAYKEPQMLVKVFTPGF